MAEEGVRVDDVVCALPTAELWGSFKVLSVEGSRLELIGWALGAATEVERLEILAGSTVIAATAPNLPRDELADQFPGRTSAATCGFRVVIEAKGKGKSLLELRAVLEDGTNAPMGEIRVFAAGRRWDVFRRR